MAGKRDYYEVLGVQRDASDAEIKRAYKHLAMKYHPDRNKEPGAAEKMQEINEAYQALSDPERRRVYDQFGADGLNGNPFGGGGEGPGMSGFEDMMGDIFSSIFNQHRGATHEQSNRGENIAVRLELTLEEAVQGVTRTVSYKTYVACDDCKGTGSRNGAKPGRCPTCNGSGQVRMQNFFGIVQQTCPKCHGTGRIITDPCRKCQGSGRVVQTKSVKVTIPAGVDSGVRIRKTGAGATGPNGGTPGDLFLDIVVKPHRFFRRDGNDLHCIVPISMTTAALGGTVEVQTLDGNVNLKIKPETQSGTIMRLPNKGVQSINTSARGHLYCQIMVETPVNLTDRQKDLLRQFEASLNGEDDKAGQKTEKAGSSGAAKHKPKPESYMDGIRKFFNNISK